MYAGLTVTLVDLSYTCLFFRITGPALTAYLFICSAWSPELREVHPFTFSPFCKITCISFLNITDCQVNFGSQCTRIDPEHVKVIKSD